MGALPMLQMDELTVSYGDTIAVDSLSLDAAAGETVAVLGPSGCGKSTLLRAVAGLEAPSSGRILLDGQDVTRWRPDQRGVGLMFQDHALFPHRDVAGNVGFGLRMQGRSPAEVEARIDEVLELVGLSGMHGRAVDALSGGEQQRVALARAIAPRPRLLMLDEPLGSLDRALRDRLLQELPELFSRLDTTVLYVTHDQDEALALADRVAVMADGRLVQVDPPDHLWRNPTNAFVARFLGLTDLLTAEVNDGTAKTPFGVVPASGHDAGPAEVVLLPDALRLLDEAAPGHDERELTGTVTQRAFAGDHVVLMVTTDAGPRVRIRSWQGEPPADGAQVRIGFDPTATRVVR